MNLELLSKKISNNLKNELNLDEDKRSIIEYGIFAFFQMGISILLVAVAGLIFNVIIEALIISFVGAFLRKFSGGAHASTSTNCSIVGIVISVIPAYIVKNIGLNKSYIIIIGILLFISSFIIIYKLAPVDSPNKPIKKKEKIKRLKRGSIIILFIYMILVVINIGIYYINTINSFLLYTSCIYIGILWQVFTLTKYGHIVVNKVDSLLIKILKYMGEKRMKKLSNKVLMVVAAFATVIASVVSTSACWWMMYQPEEPKALREE
ncbi:MULTISPECIES: AgrD family cyclic lactone autoinducer peptide [unclassified Clostridium]|uniref:AgrD family cyclic lactone autoinducer peptide n=1 Tax=unclassified Clostridium TaxID=2614128 RepID=UPI0025C58106|nr:cyclic lactone autoinducer peptide [Clostridium sp.]MDY4253149.1 cyclic lactone autoinducer peptide [Clostridium sp.]MDY6227490.1 cyclic lactone autoinducer peptide [Clostridium sp.]